MIVRMKSSGSAELTAIGSREFIAIIAALMAINSLSIDPMLTALPAIATEFGLTRANDRQWVITAYLVGISVGCLFYGPLSDRFGRKPVTLFSIALFLVATIACALAPSFELLVAARGAAGLFAASSRVISVSLARDRFSGDAMARVLSLAYVVFMMAPVIAPSLGQMVLHFAGWRWIFGSLGVLGLGLLLWIALRLPETLPRERRTRASAGALLVSAGNVLRHRGSVGYMLASGVCMAGTVAFITSAQQIFADIFDLADWFPMIFAGMSLVIAGGGFVNSRLVQRHGARRIGHGAIVAMIGIALVHLALLYGGCETFAGFIVLQSLSMLCLSLTVSNFGALAMEPYAQGAGLASTLQAFLAGVLSAALGGLAGGAYDGTSMPLAASFLWLGLAALALIAWAERGRLFGRPRSV